MKQFLAVTVPVGIIHGYRKYRPGWVRRKLSAGSSTRALKAIECGAMSAWRALFHYGLPNLGSVHHHGWGAENWGTKPDEISSEWADKMSAAAQEIGNGIASPTGMARTRDPHGLWADAPDKPWN